MLVEFLHTIDLDTTVVLFSSDHGLHYGPSFSSNGERERAEPISYLHIPPSMDGRGSQLSALKKNQDFSTVSISFIQMFFHEKRLIKPRLWIVHLKLSFTTSQNNCSIHCSQMKA